MCIIQSNGSVLSLTTSALRVQILAAQTRLAQELQKRPELYEAYLFELLTLFAEKGIALQTQFAGTKDRLPVREL